MKCSWDVIVTFDAILMRQKPKRFEEEGSYFRVESDIIRSFCVTQHHNKRRKNDDGNWRIRFQVMKHVGRASILHYIFHVHLTYDGMCFVMLLLTVTVAIKICFSNGDALVWGGLNVRVCVCALRVSLYCVDVCVNFLFPLLLYSAWPIHLYTVRSLE